MGYLINQVDVMTSLHNLLGHRNAPGGTDEDLKRYVQRGFDYAWRYYKWTWAMKTATTLADGILPADFDLDGYFSLKDTYTPTWNSTLGKLVLNPAAAITFTYQIAPPTLGTDTAGSAPFPSAQTVALGALIYAKMGDNPNRANVKQEWAMFHKELNMLAARSYNATPRTIQTYHDKTGGYVGNVG